MTKAAILQAQALATAPFDIAAELRTIMDARLKDWNDEEREEIETKVFELLTEE
jgi:hypothetical protein